MAGGTAPLPSMGKAVAAPAETPPKAIFFSASRRPGFFAVFPSVIDSPARDRMKVQPHRGTSCYREDAQKSRKVPMEIYGLRLIRSLCYDCKWRLAGFPWIKGPRMAITLLFGLIVMENFKQSYVVDDEGKRVGVFLDYDAYQKLLADLEELESIRAFDAAKSSHDKPIPFEWAIREIERDRK